MSADDIETRTLENVTFETYCTVKLALEQQIDDSEDAMEELVDAWNDANQRGDHDGE